MSFDQSEIVAGRKEGQENDAVERRFRLVEATIDEIRDALDAGAITSVELVGSYLNRIGRYDWSGICLNSVPVINPSVFDDAERADADQRAGRSRGRLHGIPFTVKDSYKVAGLTVAAGSPAFEDLKANEDAFTVACLREAGAIVLGKTNMAPMAAGGMQRGVYGRAESPYNPEFLPAAWFSGSSNGSGVATSASFAAFGLAEETLSSGRSPASNNGLVAYTPSRGVLSIRGNWPLLAIRDVVVPHTRTVSDLLRVLDVIVQDDPLTRGDLWRDQGVIPIPAASAVRPGSYSDLADPDSIRGKRIGVPTIYTGGGGHLERPIVLRPSINKLWQEAVEDFRALGAEVVEVDFAAIHHYEKLGADAADPADRGLIPEGYLQVEGSSLMASTWDEFLRDNDDPALPSLDKTDPDRIFPEHLRGPGVDVNPLPVHDWRAVVEAARGGASPSLDTPGLAQALEGIEQFRKEMFDDWMDNEGLDLLAFPANTDVGRADADVNVESVIDAWRNGVACSTGNFAIRHLGIPTVTVTMGETADIGMPAGVTLAGKAYEDNRIIASAYAFEQHRRRRSAPPRTPALEGEDFPYPRSRPAAAGEKPTIQLSAETASTGEAIRITLITGQPVDTLKLWVNGIPIDVDAALPEQTLELARASHNEQAPFREVPSSAGGPALIVAVAKTADGLSSGRFVRLGQRLVP